MARIRRGLTRTKVVAERPFPVPVWYTTPTPPRPTQPDVRPGNRTLVCLGSLEREVPAQVSPSSSNCGSKLRGLSKIALVLLQNETRIMVWRRKNEELNPKNLVGTVMYGGALVWGCMPVSGLDNDSKHTALNVSLWCLYNCPQNLKTPPQSPDLNPIKHIWRELEVRVRKHNIKTKSELKTVMMEGWMNIDAEITKKLVKSVPKLLKAVVDAKGYPTKY
ncbi:hypothetical protein AVEN_12128-1 [Araneus ventricosus]|uniref:Transposable element Tcb1 transposase n=1 Tax=Araneus ventricosus TaxID=182803 RepID=A0A4Y2VJF4_ARAVE|nr:hypothetical protein AVEN_12128-1 [Araneus ventricosus]